MFYSAGASSSSSAGFQLKEAALLGNVEEMTALLQRLDAEGKDWRNLLGKYISSVYLYNGALEMPLAQQEYYSTQGTHERVSPRRPECRKAILKVLETLKNFPVTEEEKLAIEALIKDDTDYLKSKMGYSDSLTEIPEPDDSAESAEVGVGAGAGAAASYVSPAALRRRSSLRPESVSSKAPTSSLPESGEVAAAGAGASSSSAAAGLFQPAKADTSNHAEAEASGEIPLAQPNPSPAASLAEKSPAAKASAAKADTSQLHSGFKRQRPTEPSESAASSRGPFNSPAVKRSRALSGPAATSFCNQLLAGSALAVAKTSSPARPDFSAIKAGLGSSAKAESSAKDESSCVKGM